MKAGQGARDRVGIEVGSTDGVRRRCRRRRRAMEGKHGRDEMDKIIRYSAFSYIALVCFCVSTCSMSFPWHFIMDITCHASRVTALEMIDVLTVESKLYIYYVITTYHAYYSIPFIDRGCSPVSSSTTFAVAVVFQTPHFSVMPPSTGSTSRLAALALPTSM